MNQSVERNGSIVKKYFLIRFLILLMYVAGIIYALIKKTDVSYIVAASGVVLGVILNIVNYKVNYKPIIEEQMKKNN